MRRSRFFLLGLAAISTLLCGTVQSAKERQQNNHNSNAYNLVEAIKPSREDWQLSYEEHVARANQPYLHIETDAGIFPVIDAEGTINEGMKPSLSSWRKTQTRLGREQVYARVGYVKGKEDEVLAVQYGYYFPRTPGRAAGTNGRRHWFQDAFLFFDVKEQKKKAPHAVQGMTIDDLAHNEEGGVDGSEHASRLDVVQIESDPAIYRPTLIAASVSWGAKEYRKYPANKIYHQERSGPTLLLKHYLPHGHDTPHLDLTAHKGESFENLIFWSDLGAKNQQTLNEMDFNGIKFPGGDQEFVDRLELAWSAEEQRKKDLPASQ